MATLTHAHQVPTGPNQPAPVAAPANPSLMVGCLYALIVANLTHAVASEAGSRGLRVAVGVSAGLTIVTAIGVGIADDVTAYQLPLIVLTCPTAIAPGVNAARQRRLATFRDGQSVCVNDAQAVRESDGSIQMLVGPDDPGSGNWLDTKGRTETILLARYLLPEGELAPIVCNLINI